MSLNTGQEGVRNSSSPFFSSETRSRPYLAEVCLIYSWKYPGKGIPEHLHVICSTQFHYPYGLKDFSWYHLHLVNEQGKLILFAVVLYIGKLLW